MFGIFGKLLGFSPPPPGPPTYLDEFLDTREVVEDDRIEREQGFNTQEDDAEAHFRIHWRRFLKYRDTDPQRAASHLRLALAQKGLVQTIHEERYSVGSFDTATVFKAIGAKANEAQRALNAATSKTLPPAEETEPEKKAQLKNRLTQEGFDSDYSPSKNGKH